MNASARPSTTSRRQDWNQANSWTSTKPTKPKNQSQRNRLRRHPAHHLPPHRKRRRRGGQHPLRHHMAHVDEYQDVSPLQHRLLTRWLGDNRNICVVGDPAQTIYSFAGASSYNLLNFASEFDPSPPTSDSTTTTVPHRRSSTTPTACSKPHRNAPTISNSTPSETKAAESRKPSTTAISKKPGAWLHASADSWTREHLRATAPSSPESTRSRKSSAGHWANNICATASNETADGRTPRSRMTLRPAWPCWKHLAQAATLKA